MERRESPAKAGFFYYSAKRFLTGREFVPNLRANKGALCTTDNH